MVSISQKFLHSIANIVGSDNILTDPADRLVYGQDNSRNSRQPDTVAFAEQHDQIKGIVLLCHEYQIPLVTRGRGTNTAGGTVPLKGGLVLSLERMDKIIALDADNRFIRVQTGITNRAVQDAAAEHGLFWPPDPTSADFCTVGGNLAMNAAGPRAVKYGTTREHVLGLHAITGGGDDIQTGVITTKGVTGYDLTRLLIGSEGTLAVITEATLKLTPLPESRRTLQAVYQSIGDAARGIAKIMRQPEIPCVLEFMDAASINLVREFANTDIPTEAQALLMVEIDGPESAMGSTIDSISNAAMNSGLLEIRTAQTASEVSNLWAMRKALSPALRKKAPNKINEDVVVPVTRIPDLILDLEKLSLEFDIPIVNFGHAGNGNIHVNLLYDGGDIRQSNRARSCLDRVFARVLELGGTLTGEHGIGSAKRDFIQREIGATELDLMWRIKQQFDPKNILNPGKVFPSEYWDN